MQNGSWQILFSIILFAIVYVALCSPNKKMDAKDEKAITNPNESRLMIDVNATRNPKSEQTQEQAYGESQKISTATKDTKMQTENVGILPKH